MRAWYRLLYLSAAVAILAAPLPPSARGDDVLFIGDQSDNSVKRFDAATGMPLDPAGRPFVTGLDGPRGLLVAGNRLLVVNQNVNEKFPGDVRQYNLLTGARLGDIVSAANKDAPFAPRGAALGADFVLYVGNLTTANGKSTGELDRYNTATGQLLSATRAKSFQNKDFHARGVVFGPDGLVYIAVRSLNKDGLGGAVLQFQPDGTYQGALIDDDGGFGHLNRPEGLVFGPDGLLYVTSFSAAPGDTDAIRVYGANGAFIGKIDLYDPAKQPRA